MNSRIFRGNYDILSPTGEIILPGWVVELRFWGSANAGDIINEDPDVGVIEMAPAVLSSSKSSSKLHMETSSDVQVLTVKRRASLRAWLGSRKSTPSVVVE